MFLRSSLLVGLSFIALSQTAFGANVVEQDGRISLGTVPSQIALELKKAAEVHSYDAWYVRGIYQQVDLGYGVEKVQLGKNSESGFTPVNQDVFRISEFNSENFLASIDPDGPYANGCSIVDSSDEIVVSNDNHWCDPEFTLKRTQAFSAAEPLNDNESNFRKDRIENGQWAGFEPRFQAVEPLVYGAGTYKGYIEGTNKFAFERIAFVTQATPATLKDVESIVYRMADNEQLGFYYESEYRSYEGFPRVQKNEWQRRVAFSLEFADAGEGQTKVFLVPDFWDSNLEYCPESSLIGQRCNYGYLGSVEVKFNVELLDDVQIRF